ncbi:MAG TPA: hypothetical protein VGY13_06615 [Solirubrobacteraceae bacterium]|jgi:hypothetical protein|nr:hypothetical protein [Solirubrobacteraceae bacterium]
MREYRLYLLIRHVYRERLPSESEVSALFQTTTSQSRSLIRAVASKYQYELADVRDATLKAAIERIHSLKGAAAGDDSYLEEQSEFVIEALNALVGRLDGTLTRLIRSQGTASSYVVKPATRRRLREHFGLAP